MKKISVEGLDLRLTEALKQQEREEPVLLTDDSEVLGVFVRLPKRFDEAGVDLSLCVNQPGGPVFLIVQAKSLGATPGAQGQPVFGSCRGMLTVVSEDDEHLKDFGEYMQ